jgi:hypothetical protein
MDTSKEGHRKLGRGRELRPDDLPPSAGRPGYLSHSLLIATLSRTTTGNEADMNAKIHQQRTFHLLNAEGRNFDIVATLESQNGDKPTFRMSYRNGTLRDDPISDLPDHVRADLEALRAVEGASATGMRSMAADNAAFYLEKANFSSAQQILRQPATIEELVKLFADVEVALADTGKDNPIAVRTKMIVGAAAKVLKAHEKHVRSRKEDMDIFGHAENAYLLAFLQFDAIRKGEAALPLKVEGTRPQRRERIAQFERVFPESKLKVLANGANEDLRERVAVSVRKRMRAEAVSKYVEDVCAPVWKAAALHARSVLLLPDFRVAGRPAPGRDPRTFEGFLATNGVSFEVGMVGRSTTAPFKGSTEWACAFSSAGGEVFKVKFFTGNNDEPTAEAVLEAMQSEAGTIIGRERDEWLNDMGYADGKMENVRLGEKIFAEIVSNCAKMREFFGEDAYIALMTDVGDTPPMSPEDFRNESAMAM